jgi:3-hydroxy-D-aspartate aldolase
MPLACHLAAGLRIGLGSDVAAGPDPSVFEVMRVGAYSQHALQALGDETAPPLDSLAWLRPRAHGMDDRVGSIEPGMEADLIAVDPAAVEPYPGAGTDDTPADVVSRLIFRTRQGMVRASWVRGSGFCRLEVKQSPLPPSASAVPRELAVRPDHPVAGYDDGEPVVTYGAPERPHSRRPTDRTRPFCVRAGLAMGNRAQPLPAGLLERRPGGDRRDAECPQLTGEPGAKLRLQRRQVRMVAGRRDPAHVVREPAELERQHPSVGELQETDTFVDRGGHHRPERREDAGHPDGPEPPGSTGRRADEAFECVAEPAQRLPSLVEPDVDQELPGAERTERLAESPPAHVRVERHPMRGAEPASHAAGVEVASQEVTIAPAPAGIGFHVRQQPTQPVRRIPCRLKRPAAQAEPEAGEERVPGGSIELDVLGSRLARAARRPAEDARRSDGRDEDPLERWVAFHESSVHLGGCRQAHVHVATLPPSTLPLHRRSGVDVGRRCRASMSGGPDPGRVPSNDPLQRGRRMTVPPPARPGDPLDAVDTPALVLDLDAFERNVERMADAVRGMGVRVRPHAKSNKCPEIALRQIAAGAVGVCAQKVSEAEAMVDGGVGDVLVSNEVVGRRKLDRLAALARRARLAVCADDPLNVAALEDAAARAGVSLDVLIEVNTGMDRCGVEPGGAAVVLAGTIHASAHLRFAGIHAYAGSAQHVRGVAERRELIAAAAALVRATVQAIEDSGIPCPVVTGAGTGTFPFEAASGVYTEIQPGSYVFMDADYGRNDWTGFPAFEQSLFVLATVMSRPAADRAIVDAGLKALSVDSGMPLVQGWPGLAYVKASDEHGGLTIEPGAEAPSLGRKILLVPGHCDPTVNLHDWYVGVRAGTVEALWPITARGMAY